ncbi:MAG: hypothetical protein P9M03_06600 [Candidatus Theseobacter exili]|nr:hypothetical protein [Candidatus Theseobacter exili]
MKICLVTFYLCFGIAFSTIAESNGDNIKESMKIKEPSTVSSIVNFDVIMVSEGKYKWTSKLKIRGLVPIRVAISKKAGAKWVSLRLDRLVMPVSMGNGLYKCENTIKLSGSGVFKFEFFITRKGTKNFVSLGSREVKLPLT